MNFSDVISVLLQSLGGGAAMLLLLYFLSKELIKKLFQSDLEKQKHEFNRELENYKSQLQYETTIKAKELEFLYLRDSEKFSNFSKEELRAIKSVYTELSKLSKKIYLLTKINLPSPKKDAERLNELMKIAFEQINQFKKDVQTFSDLVDQEKIFLDRELCLKLDEIIKYWQEFTMTFEGSYMMISAFAYSDDIFIEASQKLRNGIPYIEENIDPLKENLVNNFRSKLNGLIRNEDK